MYVKTANAATWIDTNADNTRKPTPRPPRVQRWATRPLHTASGTARALRFDGNYARVLVEGAGRRHWMPLALVMSEAQAEHWIRTGFARG
ncbi:MAG TPA: hypothetical protein VFQ88_16025 [Nevskiaceae bacterium]|nr:hypothetical protein [Nevskiaceae bacterium]